MNTAISICFWFFDIIFLTNKHVALERFVLIIIHQQSNRFEIWYNCTNSSYILHSTQLSMLKTLQFCSNRYNTFDSLRNNGVIFYTHIFDTSPQICLKSIEWIYMKFASLIDDSKSILICLRGIILMMINHRFSCLINPVF